MTDPVLEDPAFLARLWAFIGGESLEPDSPDTYSFACYLSGIFTGLMEEFHMVAHGFSREQAVAATRGLIDSHRFRYEVLSHELSNPGSRS